MPRQLANKGNAKNTERYRKHNGHADHQNQNRDQHLPSRSAHFFAGGLCAPLNRPRTGRRAFLYRAAGVSPLYALIGRTPPVWILIIQN